jgi:hypothetical protein
MQVDPDTFRDCLEQATFDNCGDKFEQKYGHYVADTFPNCERFWRLFVIPMTQRIEEYPGLNCGDIRPREGAHPVLQDIASAHYSMFLNLVFAHLHLEQLDSQLYSHEDFYVHLATACELADRVLGLVHLTLLDCRGQQSEKFRELDQEEFLERALDWFEDEYEDPVSLYFQKGFVPWLRLHSRDDLVEEYLGQSDVRKQYVTLRQNIRQFRNVIVHDVRVGRIRASDEITVVPKPKHVPKYRAWRDVEKAADNPQKVEKHFADPLEQAVEDIRSIESILNEIWEKLIEDLLDEFYSDARDDLRQMFDVEFSDESEVDSLEIKALVSPIQKQPSEDFEIRGSGVPPGPGSATWTTDSSEQSETDFGAADPSSPSSHRRDLESTGPENEEE